MIQLVVKNLLRIVGGKEYEKMTQSRAIQQLVFTCNLPQRFSLSARMTSGTNFFPINV